MMEFILDHYWSGTTRFAVFLVAFAWLVQILGTNIAANMISFGADSSMLFPRFINMRRGQYIVQTLAWAVVPWEILTSATKFEDFLSGYALFMGAVVAIMVCECTSLFPPSSTPPNGQNILMNYRLLLR